jgi:adenylate cyclase
VRGTRRQRRKTLALLIVAALAGGVGVLAYATHLLRRSELQTIDARFSIRGNTGAPSNIVFVAVDPATFQELHHDWPFPRKWDARVIDHLREAGARAIAVDIDFSNPTNEVEDNELYEAVARAHGKTVLAATEIGVHGETEVLGGAQNLREAGARVGEDHVELDTDGSARRFAHEYSHLDSFGVAAAEVMSGKRFPSSLFEDGTLPIDFVGPIETFHSVPYAKVLRGEFSRREVSGKLAVVGASAPVLQDIHPTAMSGADMPGPEIWANSISTLLRGVPLRGVPGWISVLLVALFGVVVPIGSMRLRQWRSLLDAVALAVVFTIAVQVAFDSGRIVTFVYPLLALALGTLGTLGVLYMAETIERARARPVRALRARRRRRPGRRQRRREPAARRRRTRLHRAVLRSSRVHQLLREAARDARHRGRQHLPQRDDRSDPCRRRHLDRLHGRRHHGRVRRAARAARPCRPRAHRRHRDDRAAPRRVQRMDR